MSVDHISSCPVHLRYAASCRLGPIFTWKAAVDMQCPDSRSVALAYHSYPPIYLSDTNILHTYVYLYQIRNVGLLRR